MVSLKKIFQPHLLPLSRATTLLRLVILDLNPNAIFSSENITEALQQITTFLSPQLVPEPSNVFTIVHHNTEGQPYVSDVKAMTQLEKADVSQRHGYQNITQLMQHCIQNITGTIYYDLKPTTRTTFR